MIPGPVEPSKDPQGDFEKSMSRDLLGELVRDAWVDWAEKQPNPKPSWLVPWSELNETDREVDRRIGDALALWIVDGCIGRVSECQTIDEAVEALAIYTRTVPQFYLVHDTWDAARAAYEADEHSGIDTTFKEYNFPCTKCSKPVAAIGESMPSEIEFGALCSDCFFENEESWENISEDVAAMTLEEIIRSGATIDISSLDIALTENEQQETRNGH